MEHNIMNIKKLNLPLVILSTLFVITFSSLAYAVLTDSVDSLKTCGEGKTYSEDDPACDGVCATNSSGEIIIASNGLPYDADNSAAYRDSCNMVPDLYRVTLYSGGLCTADPYSASGTTVDYTTNCDLFFSDASGKVITLTHDGNGAATASPTLTDAGVNLGIKTYTHAYMLMSNHLQIKHSTTFDYSGVATNIATKMQGGGASAESEGLVGGTKAAILLQDDLTTVATTMENGVVMLYAVALTTPLAITEDTTTFNIGFGLSGSVSVDFTTKDGSNELYITKHGADPVDIRFTVE
jgi:hypothetical protein